MRYAIDIPNSGEFADGRLIVQLARDAEASGWDALWIWDHVLREPGEPHADAWMLLTAAALATERIRIGPMVTPLARRRPAHLAREAVTLDQLSGGRLTLGLGNGSRDHEFSAFGDAADLRTRAAMLDEGLHILRGLWSGDAFSFHGRFYEVDDVTFLPRPVQKPSIPIWVGATWPARAPFRRAVQLDGVWPLKPAIDGARVPLTPEDIASICGRIAEERSDAGLSAAKPFDVQVAGSTQGPDPAATRITREFADAGATWWTERINSSRGSVADLRRRVLAGPPRFETTSEDRGA